MVMEVGGGTPKGSILLSKHCPGFAAMVPWHLDGMYTTDNETCP